MAENRFACGCTSPGSCRDSCCIETGRIYDSCRDRDCYENVRVILTECGNEIIGRTGNIRAKDAYILWTYINIDPVRFNRGFYTVNVRFYVKITFEACIGGGRPREFDGIAVIEKKVVLFGGESNVNVFRSDDTSTDTCREPTPAEREYRAPTAVVEVIDPVVLGADVFETPREACCQCCCEIPDVVCARLSSPLSPADADGGRFLAVSLGIFSVIRLVRPTQLIVSASEFTVPDKECVQSKEESPCSIFKNMSFPVREFSSAFSPCAVTSEREKNKCGS